MKCAACGLPLSPKRQQANCPRCGAPVNSSAAHASRIGSAQPGFYIPSTYNPPAHDFQVPVSSPVGSGQSWHAGRQTPAGQPSRPPGNSRNNRLGFTIAGLCILAGALLLVFVYFLGVQGNQNNGTANGTQTVSSPTTAPSPTSTGVPSPTATTFPGQQYIDNARLSSSPPPSIQVTNTFKTNQKIYVTFDLHPNGQSGAVCLVWFLNGQKVTSYNFKAGGNSHSTYAYAILGGTGSGSVELYWAGDISCSNDLLAQQVAFTVTQ